MKALIEFLKTILFFPLYIRKNHILSLQNKNKLELMERFRKESDANITYLSTLTSAYMSKDSGINRTPREKNVTISLTSHSYRIDKVHLAIQSLMDQELKADRIVLYLDESEFNDSNIPNDLKMLLDRGLTISYYKNLGSYKKLIPALKDYPDDLIITVDDDLIYPRSLVRKLYEAYIKEPQFIHCCRMHYINLTPEGKIAPYKAWDFESSITDAGFLVFPTGVGGVLYPPHSLNAEVLNETAFLNLAPGADDVWFKAMSLLNGVKCKKIESDMMNQEMSITIKGTQEIGLYHENAINNKNDEKIENVFSTYNLWERLKK